MLAQTIVMFLTGLVLVWYTYETLKIRKETSRQNALLVEQLALTKQAQDSELKKLAREIDLVFDSPGSSFDSNSMKFLFRNIGEVAKNISVRSQDGFNLSARPSDILPKGRELTITLNVPTDSRPKAFSFEIHYEDGNGDKRVKAYDYTFQGGAKERSLPNA